MVDQPDIGGLFMLPNSTSTAGNCVVEPGPGRRAIEAVAADVVGRRDAVACNWSRMIEPTGQGTGLRGVERRSGVVDVEAPADAAPIAVDRDARVGPH